MNNLIVLAIIWCAISSLGYGEDGEVYFSWYEWDIQYDGRLDHFHVYLSVNGSEFGFVDAMAGTHTDDFSGTVTPRPYILPVSTEPGDIVLIKVQAATALAPGIYRTGFHDNPLHASCEAGPLSQAFEPYQYLGKPSPLIAISQSQ